MTLDSSWQHTANVRLEHKDLPLAKRILPLALSLSNTPETQALNAQLQEALKPEVRKEDRSARPDRTTTNR